jgi:hypothetical protein
MVKLLNTAVEPVEDTGYTRQAVRRAKKSRIVHFPRSE